MYGKDMLDKEVVALDGWKIGKSKEIIFDNSSWQITSLDVELKGNIENELGWDNIPLSHNRLPIAVSQIQGIGDMITLKGTKQELVSILTSYLKSQTPSVQVAPPTPQPGVTVPI
jgi:sporulation protein YlmC with PRC-barrel domain